MLADAAGPLKAPDESLQWSGSEYMLRAAFVWIPLLLFISWTISIVLSPDSTLVKLPKWNCFRIEWANVPQVHKHCLMCPKYSTGVYFFISFHLNLLSCQSCHIRHMSSAWKSWEVDRGAVITITISQMSRPRFIHVSCLALHTVKPELSPRASISTATPVLSLKKHLHSNSIYHDIAVRILYWSIVKLKLPMIFPLTGVQAADKPDCWD